MLHEMFCSTLLSSVANIAFKSLGHLFYWDVDAIKDGQVTKSKKINLRVHCAIQLSLSGEVFRWHTLNNRY